MDVLRQAEGCAEAAPLNYSIRTRDLNSEFPQRCVLFCRDSGQCHSSVRERQAWSSAHLCLQVLSFNSSRKNVILKVQEWPACLRGVGYCPWVRKLLIPSVLVEDGSCDICPFLKLFQSRLREAACLIWQTRVIHSLQLLIQDELSR